MDAMFPGLVTATQVGSYFLGQYYQILQQQPSLVYQFYNETSTMVRMDGAISETGAGMLQIHSLIMTLDFAGIEIKTAHSIDSWQGGVLVMVSGLVQTKDYAARRKFVQTFFLAPQEKGYFVLTDILHLLDAEEIHQHPAAMLAPNNYESNLIASNPIPESVSNYMLGEEIQARDHVSSVHAEETETVDKYGIPESYQQVSDMSNGIDETPIEESIASFQIAANEAQGLPDAPAKECVGEQPKQTYASILLLAKAQSGNSVPQAAPLRKTSPVTSDNQTPHSNPQQPHPGLSVGPQQKSNSEMADGVSGLEDEGEEKSIFLGNVNSSVSESDIEHEFKNFGRIKPNGVAIRSRKDSGGYYAFVEFEDVIGVKSALKASPILIKGCQIYVEERRSNSSMPRGGRRGRGRGGYQMEASKGRSGGRNLGRASGQENDREYNGRSRVNGVHQRAPRQERGILGNHATRNGQNRYEVAS